MTPHNPESPRTRVLELLRGYRVSQMIAVAAALKIADRLAHGPKSVIDLARDTHAHEDSLYRLLRTLAGLGIFAEDDDRRFRLTPSAECLRSDVSGSLQLNAEAVAHDRTWRSWGALLHSIVTGETAFDHVYGQNTWDWFDAHPDTGRFFDACMDEGTAADAPRLAAAYDFSSAQRIVDVAGGRVLLAAILGANPSARGVLFNLPAVIDSTRSTLPREVADRIELAAGSFFDAVPNGGDVYILKNILHDWHDAEAGRILTNCRRAMHDGSRLLIIEQIVSGPNQWDGGRIGDLHMLVMNGGRNRTVAEFDRLLAGAGFRRDRIVDTGPGPSIVEASIARP